jgi:cytochrome c-type biogenesis protein
VAGFGVVFTVLGVTATYAAAGFAKYIPMLRVVGGLVLVVLGLNLAGILRIGALERTWRPLDAGAAGSLATTTGSVALVTPTGGGGPSAPDFGHRLGGRLVGTNGGWLASFGLGAIFAIGWTPCIGVILGGIMTLAITSGTVAQGAILLIAYCLGLGLPFIAIAIAYDRAPGLLRPLVRHGRAVALVGGLLVALIGVAMIFDWLAVVPSLLPFLTAI